MLNDIVITLPKPHMAQQRIIDTSQRFNVVDCGRRFGKTALGIDRACDPEVVPHPVGWFSPTYKMMLEVWREMSLVLQPVISRRNVQERRIENIAGGVVEFWSLDNPDAARGRKYKRVIIDEAAMVADLMDAWQHVIRPALADYEGDAWILSTPKGRNGFWQMYQWGKDKTIADWTCWQMPTSDNPFIPDSEIEAMRQSMPERVFLQEVLAEFIDDAGGVFRRVRDAATAQAQAIALPGHSYVIGVDLAKSTDFTVFSVIDVTDSAQVYFDRDNRVDLTVQLSRLQALNSRFKPVTNIIEVNFNEMFAEQARRRGLPVTEFRTTNATKQKAIEDLAYAFESGGLSILPEPVQLAELQAFEINRTKTGLVQYSAPEGLHDDTVIALALAWQAAKVPAPAGSLADVDKSAYKPKRKASIWAS